jgi:hypothetical protein
MVNFLHLSSISGPARGSPARTERPLGEPWAVRARATSQCAPYRQSGPEEMTASLDTLPPPSQVGCLLTNPCRE